ncbi:MAG TPA: IS66 family transposase [Steroidobacteraceae bacterium]
MNAELTSRLRLADEQAHSLLCLQEENARLKREASGSRERVVLLEEEIRWLKAQVFGRSAEHHAPDTASDQQMLFNEPEVLAALEAAEAALAQRTTPIAAHERKRTGRTVIPKEFPRQDIVHDVAQEQKICPHDGTALERFGEEVSERYGYQKARIWVERHIRPKYACPCCREGVLIAPVLASLLPKANVGASLLAHLVANKFVDGIPIYRTCRQLERLELDLSPSTAGTWINAAGGGEAISSLVGLMNEELLAAPFVQMDETYLQVLHSEKSPTSTHYMAVRAAAPPGKRILLFNYLPSRTCDALQGLLEGPQGPYAGRLLTDGLDLYDTVARRLQIQHFGCLVHCRRYFDKAAKVTELPSGRSLARIAMMEYLGPVFAVERKIEALRERCERDGMPAPLEQILALRQQQSAPLMAAFKSWVDERVLGAAPKSALGKALSYTVLQWSKLSRFLEDPELPAHNNVCENEIRPFAVGRRSWLFQGNGVGATASANWLSLIATAKANRIEPYAYLLHVIEELPKAATLQMLEALLPWNVKLGAETIAR